MNFRWLLLALAVFAGQGSLCALGDDEIAAVAIEKFESIDYAVLSVLNILNDDGKRRVVSFNEVFTAGLLAKEAFLACGDSETQPLAPHETLSQLIAMLRFESLIQPDVLDEIPAQMGTWLAQQRTALGDEASFAREAVVGGEIIEFPRLRACVELQIAINNFVLVALMRWHLQKPDEDAFAVIKHNFRRFLFLFYKNYYFPVREAFAERYGSSVITAFVSRVANAYSQSTSVQKMAAFGAACSADGVDQESLSATFSAPLKASVSQNGESVVSDSALHQYVRNMLDKIDTLAKARASQLSVSGKFANRYAVRKTLLSALAPHQFASLSAGSEFPVVPYEILAELMGVIDTDDMINIDAVESIVLRLADWLKTQKETVDESVFSIQESAQATGTAVKYPRLLASCALNLAIIVLVEAILLQHYLQEGVAEIFLAFTKQRLLKILVNFQVGYHLPILEAFASRYGKTDIFTFEAEMTDKFQGEIQRNLQRFCLVFCAEHGLDAADLTKEDVSVGSASVGSDDAAVESLPLRRSKPATIFVVDPREDDQAANERLKKHVASRLSWVASAVEEDVLQSVFAFFEEKMGSDDTLVEFGDVSYDAVGTDVRLLLNRLCDPAQTVSLEEINAVLQARKTYLEPLLDSIPKDVFFGVVGQEDFKQQAKVINNAKCVGELFAFAVTSVLKKMMLEEQSYDEELLGSIVGSLNEEVIAVTDNFIEIHGARGRCVVHALLDSYNHILKLKCPQYFE